MSQHYGPDYDKYIGAAGDSSPERWQKRRQTITEYKSGGVLLDLGCSSGSFLASLQKSSWKLFGIEMSPDAGAKATARSGANVFVGDILDAPFKPESFDVITCFDVLEHVYSPIRVLQKVRDWLKPGGIFYALVPNIDSAEARIFGSYWYGLELPRHLTHFSPGSLKSMAGSVGLEELQVLTARNSAFEASIRYILDDLLRSIRISRSALAHAVEPGLPFKIVRRLFRISIMPILAGAVSLAGAGESIHAVFTKRVNNESLSRNTTVADETTT
jgi:SAM-dependent methyltransferase